MQSGGFKKFEIMDGIKYANVVYPADHWVFEPKQDAYFLFEHSAYDNTYTVKLNSSDCRGYRIIVCLSSTQDSVASVHPQHLFNRAYSSSERLGLFETCNKVMELLEKFALVVQLSLAGNNAQFLDASGAICVGTQYEPHLLHAHIICRGNPIHTYIADVPLRGPPLGKEFNMRGNQYDPGNETKIKWTESELHRFKTAFLQLYLSGQSWYVYSHRMFKFVY